MAMCSRSGPLRRGLHEWALRGHLDTLCEDVLRPCIATIGPIGHRHLPVVEGGRRGRLEQVEALGGSRVRGTDCGPVLT